MHWLPVSLPFVGGPGMNLPDLDGNRVGKKSALEIAYRSLPLVFQGLTGEALLNAVASLNGKSAAEIFGMTSTEIVDLDDNLLFRGFYSTLRDGDTLEVLVAADTRLGSPIGSTGIRSSRHRSAESIGLALKGFGHKGVTLDPASRALTCYDYPNLAVRGKKGGRDILIDIDDRSVLSMKKLKKAQSSLLAREDGSSKWNENIAFLDKIWFGKSTVVESALDTIVDSFWFTLDVQLQGNEDYCVPAVALTILRYLSMADIQLQDLVDAMGTRTGNIANSGTTPQNEVNGYSIATKGQFTARLEVPDFNNIKKQLGTSASPGSPLKLGTSGHAYAACGWRDVMEQVAYYNPAKYQKFPTWDSFNFLKLKLTNAVYVDKA
jgi:hypothetical protein